jgi:P27 family predicted phage terminase small subunit
MKGGPNRVKSLNEKKAAGTYRKDRHENIMEGLVKTLSNIPDSPNHFDQRHIEKWNIICSDLLQYGSFSSLDIDMIRILIENIVIAEDAWASINKDGAVLWVEMAGGSKPIKNPAHNVYMDCMKVIKSISEQFGMTPKSRQYLKAVKAPEKEKDPFEELLQMTAAFNSEKPKSKQPKA